MSENNALTVDAYLNPERWLQMEKLAQSLVMSKAFPQTIQNAAQAIVVMQAGTEMGLKPMESIMGLAIINGQVSPWGKTTVRLLKNHGWKISYRAVNERGGGMEATVTKDDESYTDTLYFDAAVKSGYTHHNGQLKFSWKEGVNRELKLRYGVLSKIIKTYLPEVMESAGEIAEVAEDFEIIEQVEEPTTKKHEEVITATPDERQAGLKEFLEKNKNNPNKQPKPSEKDKKVSKTEENASNSEKKVAESKVTPADKAKAQESKIVTNESKE